MTPQRHEEDQSVSASSLEKPRRKRNILLLVVLLIFVVAVYLASFTHIGEETDPAPVDLESDV